MKPTASPALPSRRQPKKEMRGSPSRALRSVSSKYFMGGNNTDDPRSSPSYTPGHDREKGKKEVVSPKKPFEWGLQPFKITYQQTGEKALPVMETTIFVVPSPSARVVAYQVRLLFFRVSHNIPLMSAFVVVGESLLL